MRALVINGSPKGEKSNTLVIANAFVKGFSSETQVETVNLSELNIKPCRGCFCCWNKTPGKCAISDDMQRIYEKIDKADMIIESFPLYFFGIPSIMKTMTDRCLPFTKPYEGVSAGSEGAFHEMRNPDIRKKKLVIISTCGYVEAKPMFGALKAQYDLICGENNYTSLFCPQGELFGVAGEVRQVRAYLEVVKQAGYELSVSGRISDDTYIEITKPVLSEKAFAHLTASRFVI